MLYDAINFSKRYDALDFLDFHVIDRIDSLFQQAELDAELTALKQRADLVKERLEKIDNNLFYQVRTQIRNKSLGGTAILQMIKEYCGSDDHLNNEGYDHLDAFINGLLLDRPLPFPTIALKQEMVFYQQTPVRIILQLIEVAKLSGNDIFYDLGSGLGHIPILVHLVTGVKTMGIEYEPAYCNYANACVQALNLNDVKFINADARSANYDEGTVFFMYTPFTGGILQEVLNRLQEQSQKRLIRIFTYGPCSAVVAKQDWLALVNGTGADHYTLYEFTRK